MAYYTHIPFAPSNYDGLDTAEDLAFYVRDVIEGGFDLMLYQNSAEVNRVDKSNYLVSAGTLSGVLRDECSILTPSIVYQSSDVPTFNYVYIPNFNRLRSPPRL